jgi:SPRY domain-containing SOCS box protein 1/4
MGALVCKGMKHVKSDGNGNIEKEERTVSERAAPFSVPLPAELSLLLDRPMLPPNVQEKHAWNPSDRSLNIFVKEDDIFTFHR